MSETKRLGDIDEVVTMSNDDKFIIIVNGQEWLISKSNLQKVFTGLSSDDYAKINKIVINGNGIKFLNDKGEYVDITTLFNQDQFVKNASGLIELSGYHTHSNQENILDKFTVDDSGALLFNGEFISYTLPTASTDTLGGVKVDGTTITIDEDGIIHGANTYELPTASNTVLGGVKVDGDTIKINDGIISADVIGNWSAGTSYPVGYFVVYGEGMWECMVAHTSQSAFEESKWMPVAFRAIKVYNWGANTDYYLYQLVIYNSMLYRAIEKHTSGDSFDESKWELISGGTTGTTINDWSAQTDYVVGDLIVNGTILYQCNTNHTSGETFDETESANWTALSGEKGEKGYSPIAKVVATETGATITITDETETTTVDIVNGENGITPHIDETTKHWMVGETDTGVLAEGINGISPTATVEQTETGATITIVSGEQTTTAELTNGISTIQTTSTKFTGTLTVEDWIGDTVPYIQTITMENITSDVVADFGIVITKDNVEIALEEKKQWGYITSVETVDGGVKFYCFENKPTIALNYQMRVV